VRELNDLGKWQFIGGWLAEVEDGGGFVSDRGIKLPAIRTDSRRHAEIVDWTENTKVDDQWMEDKI
jgi:hypothetical protein